VINELNHKTNCLGEYVFDF